MHDRSVVLLWAPVESSSHLLLHCLLSWLPIARLSPIHTYYSPCCTLAPLYVNLCSFFCETMSTLEHNRCGSSGRHTKHQSMILVPQTGCTGQIPQSDCHTSVSHALFDPQSVFSQWQSGKHTPQTMLAVQKGMKNLGSVERQELSSCYLWLVGGRPLVVSDPLGAVAQQFMALGAAVVQEVAKLKLKPRNSVRWVCISFAICQKAGVWRHVFEPHVVLGLKYWGCFLAPCYDAWRRRLVCSFASFAVGCST